MKVYGIASELGATRWECISYIMQGLTQMSMGAMEASAENFSKSLACCRRFMDSVLVVYPLIGMGQVALMQGNTEKAYCYWVLLKNYVNEKEPP